MAMLKTLQHITFTNIIMVESDIDKLDVEAMVYTTISVYNLVPSRRSSQWMNLPVLLKN